MAMDDKATAAKMDPNTATAQECADWLAENDGAWFSIDREMGPIGWCNKDGVLIGDHPYPLTLDAAAGALRKPWRLVRVELNHDGRTMATIYNGAECKWNNIEGPDRMTAEYRAAVAARLAGMEGRG